MSGTGGMRWDDPFRTGQAGFYDPGTMKGLILRAQRGDRAALNHLKQSGFTDEWGNFSFSPDSIRMGSYDQSINQWAQGKGLQTYNQGPAFNFLPSYAGGDPSFSNAWDSFFGGQPGAAQPGQARTDQSTNQQNTDPAGTFSPGSGYGVTYSNTPQTVQQGQQNNGWVNAVPDWTNGGGYKFGWNYNQQTGQWTPKGPQAAGTIIGHEVGWNTPMYLPTAYDPTKDTARFEYNGDPNAETAVERAIRYTTMAVQQNKGLNAQNVFEYYLASFGRDAAAKGQSTGYDVNQFGGTTYGDKYNPGATYFNGQRPVGYQSAQGAPAAAGGTGGAGGGGGTGGGAGGSGAGAAGGTGAGQPGAAGGTGAGGGAGGATGGGATGANQNLKNIALFNDPRAQMAELYKRLNIDPLRDNAYVNSIVDTLNPVLQAWVQTDQFGTGGVAEDNIQNRINQLGDMFSNGGGGFQGVRNEFRGMLGRGNAQQTLDDLGDTGSRDMLQTLAYGANVGANDLYSKALKNRFNRAFAPGVGAYDQYVINNLGQTTLNPRQWLLQSQWADLLDGL